MKRKIEGTGKGEELKKRQAKSGEWRTFMVVGSVRAECWTSVVLSHAGHPVTL